MVMLVNPHEVAVGLVNFSTQNRDIRVTVWASIRDNHFFTRELAPINLNLYTTGATPIPEPLDDFGSVSLARLETYLSQAHERLVIHFRDGDAGPHLMTIFHENGTWADHRNTTDAFSNIQQDRRARITQFLAPDERPQNAPGAHQ